MEPPRLFEFLRPECTPIASRSRKYTSEDAKFIALEIQRLLAADIIEPARSPWPARSPGSRCAPMSEKEVSDRLFNDYKSIHVVRRLSAAEHRRIGEHRSASQVLQFTRFTIRLPSNSPFSRGVTRLLKREANFTNINDSRSALRTASPRFNVLLIVSSKGINFRTCMHTLTT